MKKMKKEMKKKMKKKIIEGIIMEEKKLESTVIMMNMEILEIEKGFLRKDIKNIIKDLKNKKELDILLRKNKCKEKKL